LKGVYDRIIVDPPFLSDDCQTKCIVKSSCSEEYPCLPLYYSCFDSPLACKVVERSI